VTANIRDFIRLGQGAVLRGKPHAGIALCSSEVHRGRMGGTVAALIEIAGRYPRGLGEYDVIYL
jgi:hypothetical protein